MTYISFSALGRIASLRYVAAALLFGLSTGLALAEGGGDSNLAVHKSVLQVQSGNYATQINQNGEERFLGR